MTRPLAEHLARVADRSTLVLTHYGRKSGKAFDVTIWFMVEGETVYLVTAKRTRQWPRNVLVRPEVKLRIGSETFAGLLYCCSLQHNRPWRTTAPTSSAPPGPGEGGGAVGRCRKDTVALTSRRGTLVKIGAQLVVPGACHAGAGAPVVYRGNSLHCVCRQRRTRNRLRNEPDSRYTPDGRHAR